ncbi:hypothetical protein KP509_29G079900 [Ceratopteris richardii]|uniref:RING-type E3 ubiquitin transferase n=1 Tax=Ceratopteris richardii TaxID=49495 RepID=A0A8T2R8H6_CERRI|nr:hypothetical protein KP509_29G079900 [Ceratopteris richardii]
MEYGRIKEPQSVKLSTALVLDSYFLTLICRLRHGALTFSSSTSLSDSPSDLILPSGNGTVAEKMRLEGVERLRPFSITSASMAAGRSQTFLLLQNLAPSPTLDDDSASDRLPNPSPGDSAYTSVRNDNDAYTGVILVVLFLSFFSMAAFSMFARRHRGAPNGSAAGVAPEASSTLTQGVDRIVIDELPVVVFHSSKDVNVRGVDESVTQDAKHGAVSVLPAHEWRHRADCVVCLTDFQEAESIRMLPRCEHCFHQQCIELWLSAHSTCPLCRRSLLPSPRALSPSSVDQAFSS